MQIQRKAYRRSDKHTIEILQSLSTAPLELSNRSAITLISFGLHSRQRRSRGPKPIPPTGLKIAARQHRHRFCGSNQARPPGFEPGTYGLEVRCSIQLSYGRWSPHRNDLRRLCQPSILVDTAWSHLKPSRKLNADIDTDRFTGDGFAPRGRRVNPIVRDRSLASSSIVETPRSQNCRGVRCERSIVQTSMPSACDQSGGITSPSITPAT